MMAGCKHPRTEKDYQGSVEIFFGEGQLREKPFPNHQKTALKVYICTERLTLESIDAAIVGKNGEKPLLKEIDVDMWTKRWEANNPWSVFVAKEDKSGNIIGRAVLDYGGQPGYAKLSFALSNALKGKGYESEIVRPVVHEWSELLVKRGDKIPNGKDQEPSAFVAIEATAIKGTPDVALLDSLMTRVENKGAEDEIRFERRLNVDR